VRDLRQEEYRKPVWITDATTWLHDASETLLMPQVPHRSPELTRPMLKKLTR
jgi:hypothetical protein